MSGTVIIWWVTLVAIGATGIARWWYTRRRFLRFSSALPSALRDARSKQLLLSGVYAFGCAFRAVIPRADVQRICLVDSWLSSVALGRSVATVAELAFAVQWSLLMRELSADRGVGFAAMTARAVVPVIVVAEVCSWYAVITTSFLGNAIEQSLWDLSIACLTISLLLMAQRLKDERAGLIRLWAACGGLFCLFVTSVDVPMYVRRYRADQLAGKTYHGLVDGLIDVAGRWVVTYEIEPWRDEMAWMTLYFSAAVWLSISLVNAPWLGAKRAP